VQRAERSQRPPPSRPLRSGRERLSRCCGELLGNQTRPAWSRGTYDGIPSTDHVGPPRAAWASARSASSIASARPPSHESWKTTPTVSHKGCCQRTRKRLNLRTRIKPH